MTDSIPEWRQKEQKFARAAPEMTLLSDHPILRAPRADGTTDTDRDADSFLLVSKLGSVFDIIRHGKTRAPMAIAVYGDWGTGKSSAMRWLAEQLRDWSETLTDEQRGGHYRVRTVWFDPWKYQKREDVWRGLIAEVILSAVDIGNANLKTVVTAARKFGGFLGRSFISFLSSIKFKAGIPVAGEADLDLESLNKIAEDYRQTAHPEKEHLNAFEDTLKSWIKDQLGAQERMVIFIDDLDRCLPEVVLEVLEALKLYLNIPQLIFVVGLDAGVVHSVVREHYRKHGLGEGKAEHYLAKMFQVEVDIAPSELQISAYLNAQVEGMDDATDGHWSRMLGTDMSPGAPRAVVQDAIRNLAEHNPREIKRLLNSTLLRGSAAQRDESLDQDRPGGRDEKRLFQQGCQVYLIQQVMRKRIPRSDGLLRHQHVARFFEEWSQFCQEYPAAGPAGADGDTDGLTAESGGSDPRTQILLADRQSAAAGSVGSEAPVTSDPDIVAAARRAQARAIAASLTSKSPAETALQALRARQPKYPDKKTETVELLKEADLWPLMRIPFSAAVALSSAAIRREEPQTASAQSAAATAVQPGPTPETGSLTAAQMQTWPAVLLSAVARKLRKDVARLVPDDVRMITVLDLDKTDIADIRPLKEFSALQTLYLDGTQVTDLAPLKELSALQWLSLDGTQVTDLAPLKELSALQTLSLDGTQVTDLAPLKELSALQTLYLDGTQVSDLAPLKELSALQTLHLDGTQVTDDEKRKLKKALPNLKIIG